MLILAIAGGYTCKLIEYRWGSLLGPVPANIFMTELETIMIPSLRNFVQNWK